MSKHTLQFKLDQLNLKIQQAHEEREVFLKEYYAGITQKLSLVDAHVLPPEVLVGAVLDAIQKYNSKDTILKKWEGMAHPFFRTKRSIRQAQVATRHNESHTENNSVDLNTTKVEKELVHD